MAILRSNIAIDIMKPTDRGGECATHVFHFIFRIESGAEWRAVVKRPSRYYSLMKISGSERPRPQDTSAFLGMKLQTVRKQLETVEEKIKEYRKAHMGELPEQLETNLRMLDRLQMQLNQRQESLRNAKDSLISLKIRSRPAGT